MVTFRVDIRLQWYPQSWEYAVFVYELVRVCKQWIQMHPNEGFTIHLSMAGNFMQTHADSVWDMQSNLSQCQTLFQYKHRSKAHWIFLNPKSPETLGIVVHGGCGESLSIRFEYSRFIFGCVSRIFLRLTEMQLIFIYYHDVWNRKYRSVQMFPQQSAMTNAVKVYQN